MMNRQTRKHYLLFPLSGLLLISLSSCDLTLQDLVHSSAAASSAAGSQNTEGLTITNKTGSTYGGTVASYSSSGANFSAKATSFDQNSVESTTGFVLPSRGKINILVIPVIMDDYKNNATEANRQKIAKAFFGDPSETSWESVASFYFKSSHKQLLLNGTVSPWYDSGYTTSQFSKLTSSKNSWEPTWNVLEGAIEWYKKTYNTDLSEFDSDSDGIIDSVWLVNSAPDCQVNTGLDQTDFWAYTYSDLTPILAAGDNYGPNYTRIPFRYSWASYDFMEAGYGSSGIDAHTYIHETGHLMGLDDYYVSSTADNYTTNYGPMGRIDMMDYNIIDHNVFSKFCYGWVNPYYINHTGVLSLKPSQSSGDCLLIPSSKGWNGSCFDEYLLVEYYTPTGLNESDSESKYRGEYPLGFTQNGIRIYHVDARMACGSTVQNLKYTDTIVSNSTTATVLAHSNTESSNLMDSSYRLIQEMDCTQKRDFASGEYVADNTSLFRKGSSFSLSAYQDSFPRGAEFNDGGSCAYKLSFSNLSSDGVVVSVTAA